MWWDTLVARSFFQVAVCTCVVTQAEVVSDSRETLVVPKPFVLASYNTVRESFSRKIDWKYHAPVDILSGEALDCSTRWYQQHPNELCTASQIHTELEDDVNVEASDAVAPVNSALVTGASVYTGAWAEPRRKEPSVGSYFDIVHDVIMQKSYKTEQYGSYSGVNEWWRHIGTLPSNSPLQNIVDPLYWITIQQRKPIAVDAQSDICTGGYVRIMKRGRLIDSEFGFDYLFSYLRGYSRVARVDVDQIDTMSWCYATQDRHDKQACAENVLAEFPQLGMTHIVVHVCDFQSLDYLCNSAVVYGSQLALMGVQQVQLTTFKKSEVSDEGHCIDSRAGVRNIYVSKGTRPKVVLPT